MATLSNDYRDGINYSVSNLNEPNPTTNALKTQEPLSPLEQANAEKHELTLKTMQKMHKTKHKTKL
ncbi:DUF3519 domain-containing protein [Helicobacter pylori]|nr:DUF3519 domain-containing protein [Helicobacter pylori]